MTTRLVATALPLLSFLAVGCSTTAAKAPNGGVAPTTASASPGAAPVMADDLWRDRADREGLARPAALELARKTALGGSGVAPSAASTRVGTPLFRAMAPSAADTSAAFVAGGALDSEPEGARAPLPITPAASAVSIKAGEWDDNANYREFVNWLATEESAGFHRVDVTRRRFLVVRDLTGKAVTRCPVTVADGEGHQTTLITTASGRAILFPRAEGLSGHDLTATASCDGSSAQAGFSLEDPDGVVDLKLAALRTPSPRTIDVAFILDTTGSMAEEIVAVKSTVEKVASSLEHGSLPVSVRVGMVAYKDRGDVYVTQIHPMTTDLAAFQRDVSAITASGGGDMPESVNEGIHTALSGLSWNDGALAQFAFLIGDAPPHLDYAQDFDYAVDMKTAAHHGTQIFTIAASGMDDLGQIVWRQVAAYTNATNLFVLRGGAGPQSTGAGDPKSSCGGTHDNYRSGQLDALILGKIRYELGGVDRDPMKIPGLRVDENAKPCASRLIAAD